MERPEVVVVEGDGLWVTYWPSQTPLDPSVFDELEAAFRDAAARMGPLLVLTQARLDTGQEFTPEVRERVKRYLKDTKALRTHGASVLLGDTVAASLMRRLLSTLFALTRGRDDKLFGDADAAIRWLTSFCAEPQADAFRDALRMAELRAQQVTSVSA